MILPRAAYWIARTVWFFSHSFPPFFGVEAANRPSAFVCVDSRGCQQNEKASAHTCALWREESILCLGKILFCSLQQQQWCSGRRELLSNSWSFPSPTLTAAAAANRLSKLTHTAAARLKFEVLGPWFGSLSPLPDNWASGILINAAVADNAILSHVLFLHLEVNEPAVNFTSAVCKTIEHSLSPSADLPVIISRHRRG